MKIISWNINSINVRQAHVLRYIQEAKPDLLLLQELKTATLTTTDFESLGYRVTAACQKAYNGVAILSKIDFQPILNFLPGAPEDEQARYLEIKINDMHIINIYLPNGNPAPGEKFDYKLAWMERLKQRLQLLKEKDIPFILGGDFNVIPEEIDCKSPINWKEDALFRIETRKAYRSIINLGLYDAFRSHNNLPFQYTFWDYQAGAWQKNNGIRIDHFLLTPTLIDKISACIINTAPRSWDKPSDHTPIELTLKAI